MFLLQRNKRSVLKVSQRYVIRTSSPKASCFPFWTRTILDSPFIERHNCISASCSVAHQTFTDRSQISNRLLCPLNRHMSLERLQHLEDIIAFLKLVCGLLGVLFDSVQQTTRLSEKLVHQQDMTVHLSDYTQRWTQARLRLDGWLTQPDTLFLPTYPAPSLPTYPASYPLTHQPTCTEAEHR